MPTLAPNRVQNRAVANRLPSHRLQPTPIMATATDTGAIASSRRFAATDAPALSRAAIDQARLDAAATYPATIGEALWAKARTYGMKDPAPAPHHHQDQRDGQ